MAKLSTNHFRYDQLRYPLLLLCDIPAYNPLQIADNPKNKSKTKMIAYFTETAMFLLPHSGSLVGAEWVKLVK